MDRFQEKMVIDPNIELKLLEMELEHDLDDLKKRGLKLEEMQDLRSFEKPGDKVLEFGNSEVLTVYADEQKLYARIKEKMEKVEKLKIQLKK